MAKKSESMRKQPGLPAGFVQGSRVNKAHRVISTGSIFLDAALGGGFATKQIARLEGKPSVGKSTIAYNVAKDALTKGMIVIWVDSEQSYDKDRAIQLGITEDMLENLYVSEPGEGTDSMYTINQVSKDLDIWLASGLCKKGFVMIIDSYDMLYSDARIEKADDSSALISDKVKIMTNFIPRLQNALTATDSLCLIINQARANMNAQSAKYNPVIYAGGFALQHGAKQEIELTAIQQVKEGDIVVGKTIRAKIIKNKYGKNWISIEYDLVDHGIDNAEELVRFSVEFGIVNKKNKTTYEYETESFVGLPKFKKWLAISENFAKLKTAVYEKLNEGEDVPLITIEEPQDEYESRIEEPSELVD